DGNPTKVHGCNLEGLRRRGFTKSRMDLIRSMYRLIFRENLPLRQAQEKIEVLEATTQEERDDMRLVLEFLVNSKRGLVR
ncbi:MAG: acyl-ACP--UDP-N-acetylglucosamine O-acyltransferase, partial [Saezia sp.]